jgi:hypothetical protein
LPQPKRPTDPPSDPPTAVVLDLQGFDGEEVNGGEVGTMAATRPPPTPSPILLQRVWILEEQGGPGSAAVLAGVGDGGGEAVDPRRARRRYLVGGEGGSRASIKLVVVQRRWSRWPTFAEYMERTELPRFGAGSAPKIPRSGAGGAPKIRWGRA